jgi:4-hydroxy-3-methylbut-2-enyl diphosphate reductase IspH
MAARAAAGHYVTYVSHRGHDEAIGAVGTARERTTLVSSATDLDEFCRSGRLVALLARATLVDHVRAAARA